MTPKNYASKSHGRPKNSMVYIYVTFTARKRKPRMGDSLIFYGKGLSETTLREAIKRRMKDFMLSREGLRGFEDSRQSTSGLDRKPAQLPLAGQAHVQNPVNRHGGRHE